MARPLSEEKRLALLDAATTLIADVGTSASTAKIAQAAGVSEGTLFTYFPTKDDLLNQLFMEIEADFAKAMSVPSPKEASSKDRLYHVWNCLVDWGLANHRPRKALRQLKVSERVTEESRRHCQALFGETRALVEACLTGHAEPDRANFYINTILVGLAELTINAIAMQPEEDKHFRQSGFDLFWKGTAA